MNDNLLRKAVDARLSGLTFTPQMQADTLRRAHPAGSTRMGRKLSYSLAFALLALLLAATAGAAAYFGVLHFHGEQENNAVYASGADIPETPEGGVATFQHGGWKAVGVLA